MKKRNGIYEQFLINMGDIKAMLILYASIVTIGIIAFSIINACVTDASEVFDIMLAMFVVVACVITVITGVLYVGFQYPLGIEMSMTRKELMVRFSSVILILHMVYLQLAKCVYEVVVAIHRALGQAVVSEFVDLPVWVFLLVVLAPIVGGIFAGAICARFGRKGGWILYWVFLITCMSTGLWTKMEFGKYVDFLHLTEKIIWTDDLVTTMNVAILFAISVIDVLLLRKVSAR